MAKEHGLEEHKGKTIPAEVRSLADRIRKKQPDVSDEYAYRTAWDIYRSHTAEGKSYPNKSPESGLAREGGGTGPISKKASLEELYKEAFSIIQPIKNFFGGAKQTVTNVRDTSTNIKDTSQNVKDTTHNVKEMSDELKGQTKEIKKTIKSYRKAGRDLTHMTKQMKKSRILENTNRAMGSLPDIAKNIKTLTTYAKWGGGAIAAAAGVGAISHALGAPKVIQQYKHYRDVNEQLDKIKKEQAQLNKTAAKKQPKEVKIMLSSLKGGDDLFKQHYTLSYKADPHDDLEPLHTIVVSPDPQHEITAAHMLAKKKGGKLTHGEHFPIEFKDFDNTVGAHMKKTASPQTGTGSFMDIWSEKFAEEIPGGKAEGKDASEFNSKELSKGTKVEMEHTGDPNVAEEIAKDHIIESDKKDEAGKHDSNYYEELDKMENKMKKESSMFIDYNFIAGFMKTAAKKPWAKLVGDSIKHQKEVVNTMSERGLPRNEIMRTYFPKNKAAIAARKAGIDTHTPERLKERTEQLNKSKKEFNKYKNDNFWKKD